MTDFINDDGMMTREGLLNHLEQETQVFQNSRIKAAFETIDRKDFIGEDYHSEAYEDYAVPTLEGETISQPTTVAFMLELLDVQPDDNVLDIGSGSGWTTALLAHLVGENGKVFGLEIKASLVDQSKKSLKKYKDLPIEIFQATKEAGLYKEGPYNRILGSVAFKAKDDQVILELLLQLLPGGVMVVAVEDTLVKFEKVNDDEFYETEFPGFTFSEYVE